jgi:HAD superfamily hydrolase (TIGR01549 family)
MADTAIFDVDGTLVDSNYQQALSWFRAFRRFDITLPVWQLHRAIGMGGDNLVPYVVAGDVEKRHGDALRSAQQEEYGEMIGEVQPFADARRLLEEVKRRGFRLVLASSGHADKVDKSLDLLGGKDLADAWTTSEDAEHSKPSPDLVQTAMQKVGATAGVMIGDSVWDIKAAEKLGVPTLAVLTGGFSREELAEAGAHAVFGSLGELLEALDSTPLATTD